MLFYINPSFPTSCSNWSSLISLQNISLMFSVTIAGEGPTQQHSPHPAHTMQTDKGKTDLCLVYIYLVRNGLWCRQELVRCYSFHSDCLGEMIYFWNPVSNHHCGLDGSVLCSAIRVVHQLSSEQHKNSFPQELNHLAHCRSIPKYALIYILIPFYSLVWLSLSNYTLSDYECVMLILWHP